MRKAGVLPYSIDVISLIIVLCALTIQFSAFVLGWPWYTFFLILLLVRQVNLVEHNHAHLRIFRQVFLNELLGWMCFLSNGVPLEFYEIHHVANHHRYNQSFDENARDWSSLFGFAGTRYPDRPIGPIYYVLTFPLITICHCLLYILAAPGSKIFRRYLCSAAIITIISAGAIVTDPLRFLFFFFLPWMVVSFGLGYSNYYDHVGCGMKTPYDSAIVDLRLPYTFLGFNIGYHVAHHLKPSLHWSLLPGYHDTIKAQIPRENYVL